jgi:DNA-binding PadR family transcriptional regulator
MAALETRLLVLGAVATFEPVNGYQIRRELLSWGVEEWAHIKPGSIYSSLSTLTGQGVLERHDLDDAGRSVAVYTVTEAGRQELTRLFSIALESVDLLAPLAFQTALTLIPLIERETFLGHARRRLANMDGWSIVTGQVPEGADAAPPHIPAVFELWETVGRAERQWLTEFIGRVEAGEFMFAGEPSDWLPPDDDPGWQMAADRTRYLKLLGRP